MGAFGCAWPQCKKKDYPKRMDVQRHITLVHKTSERRKRLFKKLNLSPPSSSVEEITAALNSASTAGSSAISTKPLVAEEEPVIKKIKTEEKVVVDEKETSMAVDTSEHKMRRSARRVSTNSAVSTTSTITTTSNSSSKIVNTRREVALTVTNPGSSQSSSSKVVATPAKADVASLPKEPQSSFLTPTRASGRIAKKKVPYEAEEGTSLSKSHAVSHKASKRSSTSLSRSSSVSSSSPSTPSTSKQSKTINLKSTTTPIALLRTGNNENPPPRKFDLKELKNAKKNKDNKSFHCLWPNCYHISQYFWNLKGHIRTQHLNLPKTGADTEKVLSNSKIGQINVEKWVYSHTSM